MLLQNVLHVVGNLADLEREEQRLSLEIARSSNQNACAVVLVRSVFGEVSMKRREVTARRSLFPFCLDLSRTFKLPLE